MENQIEYILLIKDRTELQKAFNQWKHKYDFSILWMHFDTTTEFYHTLILRERKT